MIKKELSESIESHLQTLSDDGIDIFLLEEGTVRAVIVHASRLLNHMQTNHQTGPLESLALGYAYMGVALSATNLKDDDRLNISMECEGGLKGFSVEARSNGEIRGYLKVDKLVLENDPESFDLKPFIGKGLLTVTRYLANYAEPISGTIELEYSSIAHDIANYYLKSEQTPSALSLSILFASDGTIKSAGGILLQAMPGAREGILEDLDTWLLEIPSIAKSFSEKKTGAAMMHELFAAFEPKIVGSAPLEFFCRCERQAFGNYLATLDKEELEALKEHDPLAVHVTCHNCNTSYSFSYEEIVAK